MAKDRTDESEEAVERGLEQIQRTHRGRIRWGIGKQTAELALRALDDSPTNRRHRRSAKSRRRKRHKRLL